MLVHICGVYVGLSVPLYDLMSGYDILEMAKEAAGDRDMAEMAAEEAKLLAEEVKELEEKLKVGSP